MENKGWVVEGLDYEAPPIPDEPDPEPDPEPNYNISEDNKSSDGTPFVEDISKWRDEIYDKYNLEITNIPYDVSKDEGIMIGIVHGEI
jgi:hypothetical protein